MVVTIRGYRVVWDLLKEAAEYTLRKLNMFSLLTLYESAKVFWIIIR